MIEYKITLEHDDFVLLLDVLRRARTNDVTAWDAADFICENTKIEVKEQ